VTPELTQPMAMVRYFYLNEICFRRWRVGEEKAKTWEDIKERANTMQDGGRDKVNP
jgi:hypothetical protein